MKESKRFKRNLAQFGRALSLLMNRATMYQSSHPYFKDSLEAFFAAAEDLVNQLSPVVFILSQDRFFIDEEPLDSRINVTRMIAHFKKADIQSVSFYKGITKNELRAFMEIFTNLKSYPNADSMITAINRKSIKNLKLNHVFYRKVTSDDEIVSKDALQQMTPEISAEAERKSKKLFFDSLMENILSEELEKTLTVKNLMNNPAAFSRSLIDNDLAAIGRGAADGAVEGGETLGIAGESGDKAGAGDSGGAGGPGGGGPGGAGRPSEAGGPATGGPGEAGGPSGAGGAGSGQGTAAAAGEGRSGPGGAGGPGGGGPGGAGRPGEAGGLAAGGPGEAGGPSGAGGPGAGQGTAAAAGEGRSGPGDGGVGAGGATGEGIKGPGPVLARQLQLLDEEIEKSLKGEGEVDLQELAEAVFQMKSELLGGIESQKALGMAYDNEQAILKKANELTDKVFIQLVKDEYNAGNVTTSRLAQILKRLIPDPEELKRLLPKIKTALLEEGMPLKDYLRLINDLRRELQDEGIARILFESSEQVGVDGEELIEEVKRNPKQAAQLISLAAEIKKGTGDEQALTDILVEYVESLGTSLSQDMANGQEVRDEAHLKQVITGVESKLVGQLRNMDLQDGVLQRIEEKLNERLDSIVDDLKAGWLKSHSSTTGTGSAEQLTVLQTLERSVSDEGELGEVLKAVRNRVVENGVDEDDFTQIFEEMESVRKEIHAREATEEMPTGVLNTEYIQLFIKKEIAKAARYDLPFSALAFTVVRAKSKEPTSGKKVSEKEILDEVLARLAKIVRDTDIVGKLKKNQMVALLPLTPARDSKLALKRTMKSLHSKPFELNGILLEVKVAGSATAYQPSRMPNDKAFLDILIAELVEMANRVRNIHALY